MAKGKYRSTAEAREVRESALSEAARLRREVERLTSEVARLDRENLEQQAAHLAETQRLRMLMAANTSERVQELERRHIATHAEIDELKAGLGFQQRAKDRLFEKVRDHMEQEHGMPEVEWLEWLGGVMGEEFTVVPESMNTAQARKLGDLAVRRIRKARGV